MDFPNVLPSFRVGCYEPDTVLGARNALANLELIHSLIQGPFIECLLCMCQELASLLRRTDERADS